jgi:hypothetical protein
MVEDQQATVEKSVPKVKGQQQVKGQPMAKPRTGISKQDQTKHQSQQSNVLSWGLPQNNKTSRTSSTSQAVSSPTDIAPPKNAWGVEPASPRSPDSSLRASAMAQSPSESVFKFSDIVKDEQQKTDVLTKTTNKPLHLIQVNVYS